MTFTAEEVQQIADAVWDEPLTGATHNVNTSGGKRLRQIQENLGYEGGAIWIDTVNGVAGTEAFENGTVENPVDSIADANTLSASLNLNRFQVTPGSTVTFAAAQENQVFAGDNWTLALGGQSIAGTSIFNSIISGVSTGVPTLVKDCFLNASTFAGGDFVDCALAGDITLSGATEYHFFNGHHAAQAAPSLIDFGSGVGATEVHIHAWHGALKILNMKAGDSLNFSCPDGGLTLDSTCEAGTAALSGTFGLTDNSATVTIIDVGQILPREAIADAIFDSPAAIDGLTLRECIALVLAVTCGELSGAGTTKVTIKDYSGVETRVIATVDQFGNRTVTGLGDGVFVTNVS